MATQPILPPDGYVELSWADVRIEHLGLNACLIVGERAEKLYYGTIEGFHRTAGGTYFIRFRGGIDMTYVDGMKGSGAMSLYVPR